MGCSLYDAEKRLRTRYPVIDMSPVIVEASFGPRECALDRIVDGFGENSLIIGRIIAAHAHDDALRSAERDDQDVIHQAPLLSYLAPGRIARIDESYSFPFPADFRR